MYMNIYIYPVETSYRNDSVGHKMQAICTCTCVQCKYMYVWVFDKLMWAQRAFYLAQHSSHFGTDGTVNYDYIVTNNINCLLIGSKCIPNGAHTNHCWANLAHASKHIKNCDVHVHVYMYI